MFMVTFLKSPKIFLWELFYSITNLSMHNNENSRIVFAELRLLIFKIRPMPAFYDLPFAPNSKVKFWFTDLHIAHSRFESFYSYKASE